MDEPISAGSADLNKIRERTGMMEGAKDLSLDIEVEKPADDAVQAEIAEKLKNQPKPAEQPAPKPTEAPAGEEPDGEEEVEEEVDEPDGGEEAGGKKETTPAAPAKKKGNSPIKAAFKIIGEQGTQIKALTESVGKVLEALSKNNPESKPVEKVDVIAALKKKLEDEGQDASMIEEIISAAKQSTIEELKAAGLLSEKKEPLADDDREVLDQVKEERQNNREVQAFNTEWKGLTAALKQQFPNASDSLLEQARDLMWTKATSEEGGVVVKKAKVGADGKILEQGRVSPYPLDFLLHKFGKEFETILKVAKGPKSSEGASQKVGDQPDGDEPSEENLEMPLDDQNPDTFLKMQKAKIKDNAKERGAEAHTMG